MSIALAYNTSTQASELQELIRGCERNERASQEKLYRLFYSRMMFLVCRYIDHDEQAEEVLNNGFLRAFKRIGQYDFKGSFEGWLRKVMFHCVSDYVKQHSRYNENVLLVEREDYIDKDEADKLYYNQLLELVQSLPDSARTVFNLAAIEGFSHREIGKMLNISEGTSKWHLSEARKQLKEKIEKLDLQYKK